MRDPKRIDEIMILITEIWKNYPDMRFNQLMDAIQNEYANRIDWKSKKKVYYLDDYTSEMMSTFKTDLFYLEDDKFLDFLKEYMSN